ncbi:hypothetical protein M0R72_07605 [Candidatus Pacearchaeota archaeon]|jgi:hypothetical protein|nr:hypothetical protein [Candidatus Pacearchaeota archaeon]
MMVSIQELWMMTAIWVAYSLVYAYFGKPANVSIRFKEVIDSLAFTLMVTIVAWSSN